LAEIEGFDGLVNGVELGRELGKLAVVQLLDPAALILLRALPEARPVRVTSRAEQQPDGRSCGRPRRNDVGPG
jgi:hypothetical protein